MRLALHRERASGELDLGDAARFYPTDDALERWRAGASQGKAEVVYEWCSRHVEAPRSGW